jgi:hypothetical protein
VVRRHGRRYEAETSGTTNWDATSTEQRLSRVEMCIQYRTPGQAGRWFGCTRVRCAGLWKVRQGGRRAQAHGRLLVGCAQAIATWLEVSGRSWHAEWCLLAFSRTWQASTSFTRSPAVAIHLRSLPLDLEFDAIVGRWILMHLPDPLSTLRDLVATRLRPGGIVAFQESDFGHPPESYPPSELLEQVRSWGTPPELGASSGIRMRMGMELYRAFLDAGLLGPELRLQAPVGGGPDWPGYEYIAETLRSLMPALERMTGLDPGEVEIDTLADRLRADAVAGRRVLTLPTTICAWARKPS